MEQNWEECIFHLLNSGEMSDITFLIGEGTWQKSFKTHKLLLSIASPVFYCLCYNSDQNVEEIKLPNDDPDDFQLMLNHIYGKQIEIESVQHAWNILTFSKKYSLPKLQDICREFIQDSIDIFNACNIYEEAVDLEEGSIVLKCLRFIINTAKEIFFQNGLKGAHPDTMRIILKQIFQSVNSESQLGAILEWAKMECCINKYNEETETKLCKVIKPLLHYIEFQNIRADKLIQNDILHAIFSKTEFQNILMHVISPGSVMELPIWCSPKSYEKQINGELQEDSWNNPCVCKGAEVNESKIIGCRYKTNEKSFFVTGVSFSPSTRQSVFVQWISGELVIKFENNIRNTFFEKSNTINLSEQTVKFPQPIYIKSHQVFELILKMDENSPPVHCCPRVVWKTKEYPFSVCSSDDAENSYFSAIHFLSVI